MALGVLAPVAIDMEHVTTLLLGAMLATVGLTGLPAGAQGSAPVQDPVPEVLLEPTPLTSDGALAPGLDRIARATQAQVGHAPSAERAGAGPGATAGPGHVAADLATTVGLELTPEDRAQLAGLDDLPPATAQALADLLVAFQALHLEAGATLGDVDPAVLAPLVEQARATGLTADQGWQAIGVDPGLLLDRRAAVLHAGAELDQAIAAHGTGQGPDRIDLAPALVLDLAGTSDTYTEDAALVVDVGGDDTYHTNAGGAGVYALNGQASMLPAAALFDLGGQDGYGDAQVPADDRRGQGANGGAMLGVGLLVDTGGDDTYAAYADGVNGGAFAGIGLLLDTDGQDRYLAEGWGANGGGYPAGIGQLVDLAGSDTYQGTYEAVNGGSLGGTGLLWDVRGDDSYEATRAGVNGGALGGQGLLIDEAGDDRYTASTDAVNGGADPLIGGQALLYDGGGTDVYEAQDAGAGTDVTVVPKGVLGAQWDAS